MVEKFRCWGTYFLDSNLNSIPTGCVTLICAMFHPSLSSLQPKVHLFYIYFSYPSGLLIARTLCEGILFNKRKQGMEATNLAEATQEQ